MRDLVSAVPQLLNDLYEQASATDHQWLEFLGKFAELFHADTATIRLTALDNPVIYQSFTVGFHQQVNKLYESSAVELDPFRETLSTSPLGKALVSPSIINDRAFERCDHYQKIFRPNGNFYAMGAQFERDGAQAMHIGVHRPRHKDSFTKDEQAILELFTPHLRRAAKLAHLIADLNQSLDDAHHALDQLPFGVWQTDAQLRIQWMNITASEALATHTYGLGLSGNQLNVLAGDNANALRMMARRLGENQSMAETLKLDRTGACLAMTQSRLWNNRFQIGRSATPGILCFLLDPGRQSQMDPVRLAALFSLTPAECRLANLLVRGLDVNEASALLQISHHTGRTQLKSIMHKTGVNRQTALQRKLLLCAGALRNHDE